ncbi:uncharacterized protein LOC117119407 [Anneissia japonica]|uniref:uncharacterized protein LOC117119407 n=1 Tax=Anneissia japonica TaxID=1529436 RepID=UPI00142588BA|nr:uncharacterized protein LOC117119407 [Anneissia japonica]
MASYLTKRSKCLSDDDESTADEERIPLITPPMRRQIPLMSSFKLHALLSGIYGMILVLLLVVLLTGNYVYHLDTYNNGTYHHKKSNENHVSDKSLNVFSIFLSTIGILWMFADTLYRRTIEPRDNCSIFISSKYFKAGIVVFGFIGSLSYAITILHTYTCCSSESLYPGTSDAVAIVFVITEIAYIINFSNICVQRTHLFRRFGFMHLIVTGISLWLYKNFYITEMKGYSCIANCTELGSATKEVKILTDVCNMQYIFISTAILFMMWKNIGQNVDPVINQNIRRNFSLHKSCKTGLMFGSIVLSFTIFSMLLTYNFVLQKKFIRVDYNYATLRILLDASMLTCSIILYIRIKKSDTNISTMSVSSYNSEELILLMLFMTYCFQRVYATLSLIILKEHDDPNKGILTIEIISDFLSNVVLIMQTLFLLKVLRLRSFTIEKPNLFSQVVLFYFFLNVGFCIIALVDWKFSLNLDTTEKLMFKTHWDAIKRITGPFVVGYYYQSSACLFEMWLAISKTAASDTHDT